MECGKLLQRKGYRIKILNTINFSRSMHYMSEVQAQQKQLWEEMRELLSRFAAIK